MINQNQHAVRSSFVLPIDPARRILPSYSAALSNPMRRAFPPLPRPPPSFATSIVDTHDLAATLRRETVALLPFLRACLDASCRTRASISVGTDAPPVRRSEPPPDAPPRRIPRDEPRPRAAFDVSQVPRVSLARALR